MIKYLQNLQNNKQGVLYFLAAYGAYNLFQKAIEILNEFRKITFGKFDKHRYGQNYWAVVSGASDGIGLGFVEEFAKQGINVVLLVRNQKKTEAVVNQLKEQYQNVNFKIVTIDFSTTEIQEYQRVYNEIQELDIGILVNNVGTGASFQHGTMDQVKNTIVINTFAQTFLTKLLLDKLVKRNHRSAIINLSSASGVKPTPYMSLYSATKVYNDFLSRALSYEYQNKIDILSLMPFVVDTPLAKGLQKGIFSINRSQCAVGGLNRLKVTDSTHGHIIHRIFGYYTFELYPQFMLNFIRIRRLKRIKKLMDAKYSEKVE